MRWILLILSLDAGFAPAAEERILFLGDSLTEGYMLPQKAAFPALVAERLKIQVINAGSSGSTSASAVSRLRWHLRAKEKPTILFLALGANDGLRGIPPGVSKKNLSDTLNLAKRQGLKAILAGMKMPPNYGRKYVMEFERIFPELARENNVNLLPFLLEGVAGDSALNLADGIHPNEKGHIIIADHVTKYLSGVL